MGDWTLDVQAQLADGTSQPVTGALVEVARAEPPRDIRSATTDEQGHAKVTLSGPGSYIVSLMRNDEGSAILGDLRLEVVADGQVAILEARQV